MSIRPFVAVVLADFRERTRRYGFLVTLGLTLALCLSLAAGDITIHWGGYRGLTNAAWIGNNSAVITLLILSLAGFYLVRDAVSRDRITGVAEILGTTPLSRTAYLAGKALSNALYLATLVTFVALSALAMLLLLGEERRVDLAALWLPFLLLVLPVMVAIAGVAILFEVTPGMRGVGGNVTWFFIWLFLVAASNRGAPDRRVDLLGLSLIKPSLRVALKAEHPGATGFFDIGQGKQAMSRFRWDGIEWTRERVTGRVLWLVPGLIALALATLAGSVLPRRSAMERRERSGRWGAVLASQPLARLVPAGWRRGYAEARLSLLGMPGWWHYSAIMLSLWAIVAPGEMWRMTVYPLAAIWPIGLWSRLGNHEIQNRTAAILFSAPRPTSTSVIAAWSSGLFGWVLVCSGVGIRSLLEGDPVLLLNWLGAGMAASGVAVALGTWTSGTRAFEAGFTALWYLGPVRHSQLDFLGTTASSLPLAGACVLATAPLLLLAIVGRRVQGSTVHQ